MSASVDAARLDAIVIGAGPGGLAAAAALRMAGLRGVVIDRAPAVGSSWRMHYDRLQLHTPRELSHLPGFRIPREYGRWVARDHVVEYLEAYAAHHQLDLRLGVGARRLEQRAPGWRVHLDDGAELQAPNVIVATGYNNTPREASWPGLEDFPGEVVHASAYRRGSEYAGRDVLVIGPGNTGSEIATDLADHGASRVWLAVRTPPHIVARTHLGWPMQGTGILTRRLPPKVVDRMAEAMQRVDSPDLTEHGLPRATTGLYTQVLRGRIPVQDVGVVDAIKAGRVIPVAAFEQFDGPDVLLADGRRLTPDAVVVATGYAPNLAPLVGEFGVLDQRGLPMVHGAHEPAGLPGMWFTGFTNPISGMFRELRLDAEKIARAIRARH